MLHKSQRHCCKAQCVPGFRQQGRRQAAIQRMLAKAVADLQRQSALAEAGAEESLSCCSTHHILESPAMLVGNTPLVQYTPPGTAFGRIACKLEMMNGSKSVKDRIAYAMVQNAEESGCIRPGHTTLIEPTSGNTGIALAYIAAARGYKLKLVMPESMSIERKLLLRAYGAEIVSTPKALGMKGAIETADDVCAQTPNSFCLAQFENPANPQIHYETTGPEIWEDTGGTVDTLVVGVGTGGTLTGAGRYLKEQNPGVRVVAVEPAESPVMSGGKAGQHGIAGIGPGFKPGVLDMSLVDEVVRVSTQDAMSAARSACRSQGLLVGISSGAALAAASKIAKRPESRGTLIVTVLASSGERYLSTSMFEEYWVSSERKTLY